jgi:hypothetical protein
LKVIRIAGKDFVTAEAINDMLERCTCPANGSRHASISGNDLVATANGSSVMKREKLAQAALQQILQGQKKR